MNKFFEKYSTLQKKTENRTMRLVLTSRDIRPNQAKKALYLVRSHPGKFRRNIYDTICRWNKGIQYRQDTADETTKGFNIDKIL